MPRPYEPSNGTEGEWFMEQFCYRCKHELFIHTANHAHHKCDILNRALTHTHKEPDYPKEWVYEGTKPICTAHVAHKWFNEQGELQEYEEPFEDPNQLKLF
jgi:hypothetical protein